VVVDAGVLAPEIEEEVPPEGVLDELSVELPPPPVFECGIVPSQL